MTRRPILHEATGENVRSLVESDPLVGWSVWRIHQMIGHRNITKQELQDELGVSRSFVNLVFSGKFPSPRSDTYLSHIARVEDAITRISDRKGGVPASCCSEKAYLSMVSVLAHSSQLEVE